jgi:hypothetical protein
MLANHEVDIELSKAGFAALHSTIDKGFVTVIAEK